ncbi:hypothetical protein QK1_3974 [Clostridioides difficile DA00142]|nr:hypothetical protein QK1_3974 [Clostridioides difficile DA00142]
MQLFSCNSPLYFIYSRTLYLLILSNIRIFFNFGNIINICKLEKLLDVDKFMEKVIKYEKEIIEKEEFSKIEEYMLNIGEY